MEHRINAPQRSWSLPWETQMDAHLAGSAAFPNLCPACWGQYLLFAEARCFFLLELPSCNLANDSIVFLRPVGCATRRSRAPPSPTSPRRLRAAPPVPGEPPAHLAPRAPGPCTLVATSPGAQLPARSLPKHLSGVACLVPSEQHYPIASRFIRRLGAERA